MLSSTASRTEPPLPAQTLYLAKRCPTCGGLPYDRRFVRVGGLKNLCFNSIHSKPLAEPVVWNDPYEPAPSGWTAIKVPEQIRTGLVEQWRLDSERYQQRCAARKASCNDGVNAVTALIAVIVLALLGACWQLSRQDHELDPPAGAPVLVEQVQR